MKNTLPVPRPKRNTPVRAIVKSSNFMHVNTAFLKAVDEDDCSWRFVDDNAELSNAYDVVYWEYLPDGGL